MIRKIFLAMMALALVTVVVPKASAAVGDNETIQLNVDFCTNACFTGLSGGSVTKTVVAGTGTDTTNNIRIDVSLSGGLVFHNTNAFDAFSFNCVDCGALTFSSVSTNFTGNGTAGTHHEDGAQNFQYVVDWTGGGSGITGVSTLSFIISGTSALTLAEVDSTNSGASAVDFAAAVTTNLTSGNNCTGVIGGGDHAASNTTGGLCATNTSVPEPTSVLLLGSALLFAGKLLKAKLLV